jgi:hypothetical protein
MIPVFAVQFNLALVELNTVDETPLGAAQEPLVLNQAAVDTKFSVDDESILVTDAFEVDVDLLFPFEIPDRIFVCPKEIETTKRKSA